jgi:hypothetical protein
MRQQLAGSYAGGKTSLFKEKFLLLLIGWQVISL